MQLAGAGKICKSCTCSSDYVTDKKSGLFWFGLLQSVILAVLVPAGAAAVKAAEAVFWFANTSVHVVSFITSLNPALGMVELAVQKVIASSSTYKALSQPQQFDTIRALMAPHWTRVYHGGKLVAPPEHRSSGLQHAIDRPGVPKDEGALAAKRIDAGLSQQVRKAVAELRPAMEDGLEHFDKPQQVVENGST